MRQCMDFRGLMFARDDQRRAFMFLEIFCDDVEPFFGPGRKRSGTAEPELRSQRAREELHVGRTQRQSMIRGRAGDTRRRLDDVQPAHLAASPINLCVLIQLPATRTFSRVTAMYT